MADVQIGSGGVETGLYDKRTTQLEFRFQATVGLHFICAAYQFLHLLIDIFHCVVPKPCFSETVAFSTNQESHE